MSLACSRDRACHWSLLASFIIHDSEGSSAAAGSPGLTVATGTELVTAGVESSLGLTRKGLNNLSLPTLESGFNLIHYHLATAP